MKSRSVRAQLARAPLRAAPAASERRHRHIRHEVIGLGLIALGVIVLLSTSFHAGFVARYLRLALCYLVGDIGAWAVAVALLIAGTAIVAQRQRSPMRATAVSFSVLFAVILGVAELSAPGRGILGRAMTAEPGGLVGVLLAELLRSTLGTVLGVIVLALAGVGALAVLVDTPVADLATMIGRGAATAGRAGADRVRRLRPPQPALPPSRPTRVIGAGRAPAPAKPDAPSPTPPFVRARPQPEAKPEPPALPRPRDRSEAPAVVATPAPPASSQDEESNAVGPGRQMSLAEQGMPEPPKSSGYRTPPLTLLSQVENSAVRDDTATNVELVENILASFGIEAKVVEVERGPRVTRYEIQPPPGVRVSRITNLADDLALGLAALDVRVEAPVPGKGVIGIEVPNTDVVFVNLREILDSPEMKEHRSPLAFALGKDISGHACVGDLQRMPHLLVAGATNTGKSVCLNSMIVSILYRATPDQVKFLMVDPKRVELSLYKGIPHLVAPVAHDAKAAAGLLRWAIREMETRYQLFSDLGVRNIVAYNELADVDEDLRHMYYLVIVIDELADLMMQAATEFETSICRIAQLARATGIHLVVATQRPSVNVITGTIKANIASRIAFAVASQVDSRTILDINGAERLVGSGDMLFYPMDASKPTRLQGAYVNEADIGGIVKFLKQQGKPEFLAEPIGGGPAENGGGGDDSPDDDMFEKALDFVLSTKYASASMLQRKLRIGYTRAARLVDMMEERGYVGPADGSRPREVYSTPVGGGGRSGAAAMMKDDEYEEALADDVKSRVPAAATDDDLAADDEDLRPRYAGGDDEDDDDEDLA